LETRNPDRAQTHLKVDRADIQMDHCCRGTADF